MEIGLLPLADPLIVLTLPTYTKVAVTFSTFGYFLTKRCRFTLLSTLLIKLLPISESCFVLLGDCQWNSFEETK